MSIVKAKGAIAINVQVTFVICKTHCHERRRLACMVFPERREGRSGKVLVYSVAALYAALYGRRIPLRRVAIAGGRGQE